MRKPGKKKGMHPGVAALLFAISAAVASRQLMVGAADSGSAPLDGPPADDPATVAEEGDGTRAEREASWRDLLAAHGSFDAARGVRLAFVQTVDAIAPGAAPAGESRALPANAWIGADPPALPLGVVMISGASRRAVLGGSVVGLGDEVAGGKIVAIERGQVVLSWNGRILTYDLDDGNPREFRAEAQRRLAAQGEAVSATATTDAQVQASGTKGK